MSTHTELHEWIKEHKVCWELFPYKPMGIDGRIQVGFELDLYAQHLPSTNANPGCKECEKVFKQLEQIAHLALPAEFRPTRCEIQQFDASFHLRPETKLKPEIQLTILIVHREGFFHPVDECERKCADEIQKHLKSIGVQRKVWSKKAQITERSEA